MTVEAVQPVIRYNYTGPGNYGFDFLTFHASDIKVTGIKDDVETAWEYLTDYTVTLEANGGYISTTRDSTEADSIRIMRVMDIDQPVDWVNGGPLDMDLLERSFDHVVMLIQQIQAFLDAATVTNWRGSWLPQTEYSVRDLVEHLGSIYFCMSTHTSSDDFTDDKDAGLWEMFIALPDIGDITNLVERAEQAAEDADLSANAADQFARASLQSASDSQNAANESTNAAADAAGFATKSEEWAQNPEDAEVEPGEYSAYHWAQKAATFNPDAYYEKSDHIAVSTGSSDAGKPIVLDGNGKVDPSMMSVSGGFTYIGPFTPASGAEYPDNTGLEPGSYWDIEGVDGASGYTFEGGDLAGQTAYNGDLLVSGVESWTIIEQGGFDPSLYYKLDGTKAITAPFAGGNQQYLNLAAGTADDHAVNLGQLNNAVAPKADTSYVDSQDSALQANIDAKADTTYVDSQDSALQSQLDDKLDSSDLTGNSGVIVGYSERDSEDANNKTDPCIYAMNGGQNPNNGLNTGAMITMPSEFDAIFQLGVRPDNFPDLAIGFRAYMSPDGWTAWKYAPTMRLDGDTLYIRDDGSPA